MNRLDKYYPKENKYHNQETVVDGIKFDSKLEATRYCQLKILQRAGEIKNLQRQVPYVLIPGYVKNGKTIRPIKYLADFTYFDCKKNKLVIEDVKSTATRTDEYKLKKKLFEWRFPDLEITEVTKDDI